MPRAVSSVRGTLSPVDWTKLWKSALLGSAGAVVTYLIQLIPTVDFGAYTIVVVPIVTWGLNFLRKLISGPVV